MNVRIFWVHVVEWMYARTRPQYILSSERVFGEWESEPMLTPREKSPLPEKNLPRGASNPWRWIKQDSEPNTKLQKFSLIYISCGHYCVPQIHPAPSRPMALVWGLPGWRGGKNSRPLPPPPQTPGCKAEHSHQGQWFFLRGVGGWGFWLKMRDSKELWQRSLKGKKEKENINLVILLH